MAGLGSAVIMIDPTLPAYSMSLLVAKAFIGGAVGAYFGNHVSTYRTKRKARSTPKAESQPP